jgi:hypothetical protein
MGYHVTILRSRARRQAPIARNEVEAAVAARSDLVATPRGDELEITLPAEGGSSPLLIWQDGEVWTSNPDERTIQLMLELAEALGARVRGDELETYRTVNETFIHPDDEKDVRLARSSSNGLLWRSRIKGFIPILVLSLISLAYGFRLRHCASPGGPSAGIDLADAGEVRTFLGHFFLPGTTLRAKPADALSLGEGMALKGAADDACSDALCNGTREYFLEYTPNFLFSVRGGRKVVVGADPDAFVDLCGLRTARCHRVRVTGTDGDILGVFWSSDTSFVVYGIESGEGFVEVYDLEARTRATYVADRDRLLPEADRDAFVRARYGTDPRLKTE